MSNASRRKFLKAGLAAGVGASGLAVAATLAKRYGLIPPDSGGIYGPGETLTYAAAFRQRDRSSERQLQTTAGPRFSRLADFDRGNGCASGVVFIGGFEELSGPQPNY